MNPEVKAKWLVALRSRAYKQGKGCLKRKTTDQKFEYCCLGVLCEVLGQPSISSAYLDPSLAESVGLPAVANKYEVTHKASAQVVLARMNDGITGQGENTVEGPKSFPEIADWIEENL